MLQEAKTSTLAAPIPSGRHQGEISTADLLARIADHKEKKLLFSYEGRDVSPGYHVTEVKNGTFEALDCGAAFETWQETFVQLWDIPPENDRGHMRVAKFMAIIGKVSERVLIDVSAKLTFEVSDGVSAMQLYKAASIIVEGEMVRVELTRRPSSCKPRDRWLEKQASSCCATKQPCCN